MRSHSENTKELMRNLQDVRNGYESVFEIRRLLKYFVGKASVITGLIRAQAIYVLQGVRCRFQPIDVERVHDCEVLK